MNKNHRIFVGGALLIALVSVTLWTLPAQGQQADRPPSSTGGLQNGRFQLYQGSYEIRDEKNRSSTGLFKVDTATGRVWRYEQDTLLSEKSSNAPKAKWVDVDQF